MGSLLSGALSWLAVVTAGRAPILVYWLARVIGQALLRKTLVRRQVSRQPGDTVPSEGEQTAANPSVKHRLSEAARGKRLLVPLSI